MNETRNKMKRMIESKVLSSVIKELIHITQQRKDSFEIKLPVLDQSIKTLYREKTYQRCRD